MSYAYIVKVVTDEIYGAAICLFTDIEMTMGQVGSKEG